MLQKRWDHSYTFWALLSLPAIPMLIGLTSGDPCAVHDLLHPTGEFVVSFMLFAMMITPLTIVFQGWRGQRWLMKRRRHIGVAAFGYALAHTVLYLIDEGAVAFTSAEIGKLYIWTGWIAFLIFVPLAVISTDGWVRSLGASWKTLQRFVYAAAVLTLVHWAAMHDWGGIGPAVVHFLPLTLLEAYRIWKIWSRQRHRAGT